MKKFSIEIYFDKNGHDKPLDLEPQLSEYRSDTKLIDMSGKDYEDVKIQAKAGYPTARYLHLIEVYDLRL